MSSVHIGIRHDDDFVVAEFGYIKIVMNTCSKCSYHGLDFRIAVNTIHSGLLHVENFTAQGKYGLSGT
ncbi:unknown [Clostridium clostridioforme CAG:132]|uniref:Uncharacterized protein n=1 Tax=[Clostridium] clostridioforme CAG:132 TaxID=1263065 RepID=R6KFT5_9FIRM|nr:unknown [[Clostridium] clostridioforme CAG:132]